MRSDPIIEGMMNNTIFQEWFSPAEKALMRVRYSDGRHQSLPMKVFCILCCLRHLERIGTLREQVQKMFHLFGTEKIPVPRSTYSDALNSESRRNVVSDLVWEVYRTAKNQMPDRLEKIEGIGNREIYAVDGSYQKESCHYQRRAPKDGGVDNPKGHMMLSLYDVRIGCPVSVEIETQNVHESVVFKEMIATNGKRLTLRNSLWVLDRAYVDMPYWDQQKKRCGATMITRWKENLVIESAQRRVIATSEVNEGVLRDELIQLRASKEAWRKIDYRAPSGEMVNFLTSDLKCEPGLVAFLYLRRWDLEKCFDNWKNDFSAGKAWGKTNAAIHMQALFAVLTTILTQMFGQRLGAELGVADQKSLRKQEKRWEEMLAKKKRIPWYVKSFQGVSRISKQFIRFLQNCLLMKPSSEFYEQHAGVIFAKYV